MYSDEKEGFIIEADEPIGRGQMVFDSYGRKCNSRFLLNYGFILEDNDANEVAISVADIYSEDLDLIQMKEEVVLDSWPERKTFRVTENTEG